MNPDMQEFLENRESANSVGCVPFCRVAARLSNLLYRHESSTKRLININNLSVLFVPRMIVITPSQARFLDDVGIDYDGADAEWQPIGQTKWVEDFRNGESYHSPIPVVVSNHAMLENSDRIIYCGSGKIWSYTRW